MYTVCELMLTRLLVRICPGRHLADASLFLTIATILSLFEITNAIDKTGLPIVPVPNYKAGVIW